MSKKIILLLVLSITVGSLSALLVYLTTSNTLPGNEEARVQQSIKDVEILTNRQASFDEFVSVFVTTAREDGAVFAFNVLKNAELPFGLDSHLLAHSIGDILYEQVGIKGMALCTHDFRNACSHTMVIGALIEFGAQALPEIRKSCHSAPGGTGAYTMCFHGLGHGVLAFNSYDMPKTVAMCDKLGADEFDNLEAIECFGGAIMEMIGGGGHNQQMWELKRMESFSVDDPFGFCTKDFLPEKYRSICYTYMTPYAYEAFGADMAQPTELIHKKVFELCSKIPSNQKKERKACYGGQGKEFVGLAVGRNFVNHDVPSLESIQKMYNWCALAKEPDGFQYCIESVVDSLYWGGENPYEGPIIFCNLETDGAVRTACFSKLTENVGFYIDNVGYRTEYCEALPVESLLDCRERLL
ncbi:MAG: hypothetical protein ACI92I_000458 [Acidimicrobiales bacterium]|jgi:hypothetical protein